MNSEPELYDDAARENPHTASYNEAVESFAWKKVHRDFPPEAARLVSETWGLPREHPRERWGWLSDDVTELFVLNIQMAIDGRAKLLMGASCGIVQNDTRINYDERLGEQAGIELHAQVVVPGYHALPALIVGTDRIATLQMRLAEKLAASHPIRLVPLPTPLPVLEEAMMWHPIGEGRRARVAPRRAARDSGGVIGYGPHTAWCGATRAATSPGIAIRA